MDLPTCPACKQSVLDDDAVDCPFCGAPLKGGAAPARPAPAARAAAAKSPSDRPGPPKGGSSTVTAGKPSSPAARGGRPAEEAPAATAEDDPFGVDPAAAANAIPVSRQPGAGKTIEVSCPMCETKGYISPKASGKQVKCCNPQCMVPLFTAPDLEKKVVVAAPPPPKKKLPWMYIGLGVASVAIAGVSIYYMQDRGPTELPALVPAYVPQNQRAENDLLAPPGGNKKGADGAEVKRTEAQTPEAARDAIIKQALSRILEVGANIPSQRKPTWRRLAATAYFYADDQKLAREQLKLLERASNQSPWEAIPPLVNMAWRNAKSPKEFKEDVDEAAGLAEQLPVRGRFATEASVALAPLLVVTEKADAARALLAKHRSEAPLEQLAAAVRIVIQDNSFNLDTTLTGRSLGEWQAPLDTAVTLILTAHGRWNEAAAWAAQIADPVAKAESVIVWSESFLRHDSPGLDRAIAAGKDLAPEDQARLLARLAAVRFAQGDKLASAELLKRAREMLNPLTPPGPVIVEGIKPLLDLKLEPAVSLKQKALAAAEIAGVQAQIGDAGAWDSILVSLRYLSGIGPAITPTQARRRQVDGDSGAVSAELKKAMALKKQDEERRALTKYKQKLRDVEAAAASRFQAEVHVLEAAANFGLLEQVWDLLDSYDRRGPKEHQPLIASPVSVLVAERFIDAGNAKKGEQIATAVESRIDHADPEVVKLAAERELKGGNVARCAARLNAVITPNGHVHQWVLRLAARLVNAGKIGEAIDFCNQIKDPILREEGLYLTAALAARSGKGIEFWKHAKDQNLGAMESTAASSGIVVGLKSEIAK